VLQQFSLPQVVLGLQYSLLQQFAGGSVSWSVTASPAAESTMITGAPAQAEVQFSVQQVGLGWRFGLLQQFAGSTCNGSLS
jgi:hypothetical protein